MADTSRSWTNTYRGPDDATMIGAFARDAAAATAAGWRPIEQEWGIENGTRVLMVRFEGTRDSASTAAEPAATPTTDRPVGSSSTGAASASAESAGAASAGASSAIEPPASRQAPRYVPTSHSPQLPGTAATASAAPLRDVARSTVRSRVATLGGLLVAGGAALAVLGPSGDLETAGFSAAAIGLGVWLASRVAQRIARLRAGIRRPLGGAAWTLGLAGVSAWLVLTGIARLPTPSIAAGIVAIPSTAPATEVPEVPAPTPQPVATPAPIPTPPAPAFTIETPEDGDVVESASVEFAGSAAPGARVTCTRPPERWTATADGTGFWSMVATLDPGANTVTCEIEGDVALRQSVIVTFDESGNSGAMFTISSSGGPEPFDFGPFELPAGSWEVTWAADGPVGCAARFEIVPDPATGSPDAAFGGPADSQGSASGTRTFDTSASGGHVIHALVDCDTWTITLGRSQPGSPPPTP